jgi:hypothetical protein
MTRPEVVSNSVKHDGLVTALVLKGKFQEEIR